MLPQYDLQGHRLEDISRDAYYEKARKEWQENGKISTAIGSVWISIIHPEKGMLFQLRAKDKRINPGVWDTTVGHVHAQETPEEACIREVREELDIPVVFVPRSTIGAYKHVSELEHTVFATLLSTELTMVPKFVVGIGMVDFPVMLSKFYGYYTGNVRLKDGEVTEIRYLKLIDLLVGLRETPEQFAPYGHALEQMWRDGRQGILEAAHYRVSVKALITNEEGKLLLLRQRLGSLDLPGGGLEHGEEPTACLIREVAEETGQTVDSVAEDPFCLVTFETNKYGPIVNIMYRATSKADSGVFTPSDECMELCYMSLEELLAVPPELLKGNLLKFREIWRQRGSL